MKGPVEKYIKIILSCCSLMLSLIDDILDNSKIDKESFVLMKNQFTLTELLEEVIEIFEIQAKGKGLHLYYEL